MDRDWDRLGDQLAAARRRRDLTQKQAAEALRVDVSTLQAIEQGTPRKKVTNTIRSYSDLVGWTKDSPEIVLAGGQPLPREEAEASAPGPSDTEEAKPRDLSADVLHALAEGLLIGSQVLTITTDSGEVQATVVARVPDGASPEQVADAVRVWREQLRTLGRGEQDAEEGPSAS